MKNAYFLVEKEDKQIFVVVTEDFIESRVLNKKITTDKFELGEYGFRKCNYKVTK